jgi:DNA primase
MIDYTNQLELRGLDVNPSGEKYVMICCPFHEEEEPSCSVSTDDGSFRCFGCHVRGEFFELIAQVDEVDLLTAKSRVNNMVDPDGLINLLEKKYSDEKKESYKYLSWNKFKSHFPSVLESAEGKRYLYNRGISVQSMSDYKIRFCNIKGRYKDRVVIPIFQDGYHLVSWVGRLCYDSFTKPKTIKTGTPYYTLFGIPQLKVKEKLPYLILVEGELDAVYLRQYGLYVVSVMGSGRINRYRVSLLKSLTKRVVIAFDGDAAGRDGSRRNYYALKKFLPVELVTLPWGTDPNVLDNEQVYEYFSKYFVNFSEIKRKVL